MASFNPGRTDLAIPEAGRDPTASGAPDELLAPVIAGAYARGMADTLDLLGLAGVFLDRAGEVLFASRAATALLRGPLRLQMRHLVAEQAGDNQRLGAFIADAVGAADGIAALRLPGAALELRRLPRTEASGLPGQMVRAVVLLVDGHDAGQEVALRFPT